MRWAPLCCFLAASGLGCQRKAPGPDECVAFAQRAVGVVHPAQLRQPAVRERIDDLTTRCLTTPFDRELLQCVELTQRTRACTFEFEARRARGVVGQGLPSR
jgi:hypothetical protein